MFWAKRLKRNLNSREPRVILCSYLKEKLSKIFLSRDRVSWISPSCGLVALSPWVERVGNSSGYF
jgi:hypothetical protein